jgi:ANTAR domain-containing protein
VAVLRLHECRGAAGADLGDPKGVIAERHHVDMDVAFTLLCASARNHNRRLAELSRAVVEGSETV